MMTFNKAEIQAKRNKIRTAQKENQASNAFT